MGAEMELSQPRPCGTQGTRPTHDFLSLYSPAQQDPIPIIPGDYLRTQDFLQPLERVEKDVTIEGNKVGVAYIEKCLPPAPSTTVEHILPGGIGTYNISHISYISQSHKVPKPEGVVITAAQSSSSDKYDENSNCSSYTGSGFTLWEEPNVNKGKTGKENIAGTTHVMREGGVKIGAPWTTSMVQPSQSSSIHNHRKNQSFVGMLKSAKSGLEEENHNEEEFLLKKELSSLYKGDLSVKVDTTNPDQTPNTPRSKHSATEQRRRSKINDRFLMLRELIPHADQKRDKASFLLEVIEYIQFLQEKVHKYEDSYQGWTNEPPNVSLNNSQRPTEGFIDQPQLPNGVSGPAFVFAAKCNESNSSRVTPNYIPPNSQNLLDSGKGSPDATKGSGQHPQSTNKPSTLAAALHTHISGRDSATIASQPHSQLWDSSRSCTTDKLGDQELIIESGRISISTIYSQGLLSGLTQALKSSGVDLSQANISVQIDLGKRSNTNALDSSTPNLKENETRCVNHARLASSWEDENGEKLKRLKRSR